MRRIVTASIVLGIAAGACQAPQRSSAALTGPEAPRNRPRGETACAPGPARVIDISAGQGPGSGNSPWATIDTQASKLLVVTSNDANGSRASLFRCELDGSACEHHDVSAGLPPKSGTVPQLFFDRRRNQLLVLSVNQEGSRYRLALVRCELDGTRCAGGDVPGGELQASKTVPEGYAAVFDPVDDQILVVYPSPWSGGPLRLVRCRADGSACAATDLDFGEHHASGVANAVLDSKTRQLSFITAEAFIPAGAKEGKAALIRCALSGSPCEWTDLDARPPDLSHTWASEECGKLFVAGASVYDEFRSRPDLWSCALDGSGCIRHDLGWEGSSGVFSLSNLLFDPVNVRLVMVAADSSGARGKGANQPWLVIVPLH
jgi:hypothetical protein